MASTSIKITYTLKPPANIDSGGKESTKTHVFEVKPATAGSNGFYTALRVSLADARHKSGEEMTAWLNIVGKAELGKGPNKVSEDDEDDDEETEEEQL